MKFGMTQWRVAAIVVLVAASLVSAPQKRLYNSHQKAFFADAQTVEFVRPGLTITIQSAAIAADGTITVNYAITDPSGLPLDLAGVTTPGPVSLSYIAAVLPNKGSQYTTYTTRTATGTVISSTQQPGGDSGGSVTPTATGYQYVFHTKAPSGFDTSATHTIGIYGSRNLSTFSLPNNFASAEFNFVPNGAKVTHVDDVVRSTSCNACHDQVSAHGGSRRGIELCVLCHTPQNVDPNTGQTMDARVFFHKLHMGANLPSVKAGTPYIPAKNQFGTFDFSDVAFPADPGDPRRCEVCHSQTSGATQATAYLTNPTRATCGSCHDDVNFATGVNHAGGPQFDDNLCATCHIPQGEMDFDASIKGAHVAPTASSLLSGLTATITNVTNGSAGKAPTVQFTLLDNSKNGVAASNLGSLSFTLSGPTTDYGNTNFGSDVTTPGYVTESALAKSTCDSAGNCSYAFTHSIPAGATGTFVIGVEARRTEVLLAGTTSQQSVTYGAPNTVMYFAVDGSTVAPRRKIVAEANCQRCHVQLSLHGGLRNNVEYCVLCHNPNNTDAARRVAATNPADKAAPPQGINFNLLVHRIHYGSNMQAAGRSYVVVGFGGSHNDFSDVGFPAMSPTGSTTDTRNCSICHVNSSEQNDLNLMNLNKVTDPQGPLNPVMPFTSACTGCHVTIPAASHALSNTTVLGEACAVCHTSGAAYAVDQVHAQY